MPSGSIAQIDALPTTTWGITIGVSSFTIDPLFEMSDGQTLLMEVRVVGHRASGSGGGAIVSMACFSNDGGTVTQVGPARDIFYAVDADLTGTAISWEVSGAYCVARVNSASANSYYWHASVRTDQISEVT